MEPLFLRACRGEATERTPLWLMRQAGRYLPEYRQVRAGVSFLELCKTPKLAAEVTLQPIRRFGFDAAILFSDLLVPLEAMGLEVEFTDHGPRLPAPMRAPADLARIGRFDPAARTGFVLETIQLARRDLGDTPLIGFAGAPFTVATYAIEGKTGKTFSETKTLFYREPEAARRLLALIGEATRDYLLAQIRAGAQAVQLFDSWVGVLSAEDFETFVLPPTAALVAELRGAGVPVIYFGNGAAAILDRVARVGADVYGVDWRLPLDEARARLQLGGDARAVQGNLDPAVLLGPIAEIERRARDVVRRGGKRGHVFNLGHGITPEVPIEAGAHAPIGLVVLNLGGPASLEDVEPFLRRLFGDPDVIQLGWLSFLQPLLARMIARRRGPTSRAAYQQIGGRSPIREETTAQANAIAAELARRGLAVKPVIAMAAWHPLADEALGALAADKIERAVALPLYPHESRATTGSSLNQLEDARARQAKSGDGIEIAAIRRYPDADGYLRAVIARVEEAIATLPDEHRATAPVMFSAHGLPEAYIKRGDPYLDDVRITVEAVTRRLKLGARASLCFQSRVGPQKWLGPTTEAVLDELAAAGEKAVVVVPIAFTGEHIETLQEIDILYKERAAHAGIVHFARARTVGCHPAFIAALADLVEAAVRARGWA